MIFLHKKSNHCHDRGGSAGGDVRRKEKEMN